MEQFKRKHRIACAFYRSYACKHRKAATTSVRTFQYEHLSDLIRKLLFVLPHSILPCYDLKMRFYRLFFLVAAILIGARGAPTKFNLPQCLAAEQKYCGKFGPFEYQAILDSCYKCLDHCEVNPDRGPSNRSFSVFGNFYLYHTGTIQHSSNKVSFHFV